MSKIDDYNNIHRISPKDDIPQLDIQTANQLLHNVLSSCDMEPNTIPIEVLESWGNYNKPRFGIVKRIAFTIIILLILLPLFFFKPVIIAERTNVDSTQNAVYNIDIKTLLPVSSVNASLNGTPVALSAENSKNYQAELTENGEFEITAIAFNGQIVKRKYTVSHIDSEKPELVDSYSKNGYVYILVQDTYSGVDYENITGLTPEAYDTDTGLITFKVPATSVTIEIPDKAGNKITLLLSPVN